MAQDDLYLGFIDKLKAEKSEEEVGQFIAAAMKFSAAQLYMALFYFLTDEDLTAIEQITDTKGQEEEIRKRFQDRTGVTIEGFVEKLRDTISKNYLFPELQTKAQPPKK